MYKFVISNSSSNKPSDAVLLVTSSSSNFPISITTGNLTTNYLFDSIYYNGQVLESYFYTNNQWNKVTEGLEILYLVENKVFYNSTVMGGIETGTQFKYTSGTGLVLARPSNWWAAGTFSNRVDFSGYTTLTVTAYCTSNMEGCEFYAGVFTYPLNAGTYSEKQPASAVTNSVVLPTNSPKEYTFDISSWDFSGYLGFAQNSYYDVVITNLNLTKE